MRYYAIGAADGSEEAGIARFFEGLLIDPLQRIQGTATLLSCHALGIGEVEHRVSL